MTQHSPENDRDIARSLGRLEGRVGGLEKNVSDLSEKVENVGEILNAERVKLAKFSAGITIAGFVALKVIEHLLTSVVG